MIHIVSDTSANLSPKQIAQHQIHLAPIYLYFGSRLYREGIDISPAQVHEFLSQGHTPTTNEPPSHGFEALYGSILAQDPDAVIFSIHVSGALSGVVASAQQAAAKLHNANIQIVDTRSCTIGHALMVQEAARLADQPISADELCAHLDAISHSMQVYFTLETLGPLANSGRLYRLSRMALTLGRMKPLIRVKDGTLEGVDKYAKREEAIPALINLAAGAPPHAQMGVVHADREDDACALAEHLQAMLNPASITVSELGPAFSYYFSRGALGVGWF